MLATLPVKIRGELLMLDTMSVGKAGQVHSDGAGNGVGAIGNTAGEGINGAF
jgi:hypothetical protein